MKTTSSLHGNSSAEDQFIALFCETYGADQGEYVYPQYPTVDIYGKHRTIDFALNKPDGRIAIEVDGTTWHQPGKISTDKYHDDLLKQNSLVHDGWRVFRWTDEQLAKAPDRVKDELITFLGDRPLFQPLEDTLPQQKGTAFALMDHQEEALESLQKMRSEHQSIALLYHATGTGKTVTAISDAKQVGKRTLFLVHRHELVEQAVHAFEAVWPEISVGRFESHHRETQTYAVVATVQSIAQHLDAFHPEDFGYLILDECHHGTADTYRKILSYFHPAFTLGLTATPDRADGEDLLSIFQHVAHKLDLQSAVELDALVPVRCIRIRTNIDMRDVRIHGFKYNALDLESTLRIPERNQVIVDTYKAYITNQPTVVFCASVRHAQEIAARFLENGIHAACVSGSTPAKERTQILLDYEHGKLPVLCACDLLNEGWDSPHTQVLFMARPTMSKTIYLQQLGRGMRKAPGKEFLMVFDFVDNANLFNMPYSVHRLLGLSEYVEGGLVLGKKSSMQFDQDLFRQGQKPEVLIDYPIHVTGYETINLFNWQDQVKNMLSQAAFTQMVQVQSETVDRYIREGKILPDLEVPMGENRSFKFFHHDTIVRYAKSFGWKLITRENIREIFMQMVSTMTMSYSYKPVFLLAFLDHMDEQGKAPLALIAEDFAAFYESRKQRGLPAEKRPCIFTKGDYTPHDVERLILSMPFKRFEDMHAMHHARTLGILQFSSMLFSQLTQKDFESIRENAKRALTRYFEDV